MTGIQECTVAQDEYSIDLAKKAMQKCLNKASIPATCVEVIIACNICRYDEPGYKIIHEPSTSVRLASAFSMSPKLVFDVNNACSGVMTGLFLLDSLISSGEVKNGIVVSGEYISHIGKEASFSSIKDPRLASLTLGDSGCAILLQKGADGSQGFSDFHMITLGEYAPLCTANLIPHKDPGYVMNTDLVKLSEVGVKNSAKQMSLLLKNRGLNAGNIQHLIAHQTGIAPLKGLLAAYGELEKEEPFDEKKLVVSLQNTGNTASTSLLVALSKAMEKNLIKENDKLLFTSQASGLTLGGCLYHFDSVPFDKKKKKDTSALETLKLAKEVPLEVLSFGFYQKEDESHTVSMAALAIEDCLLKSKAQKSDINLLIYTGTYKSQGLDEPSHGALLCHRLGINHIEGEKKLTKSGKESFAFDVINGPVGFLKGLFLLKTMMADDKYKRAIIAAAEDTSLNLDDAANDFSVAKMASALLVRKSVSSNGFFRFYFSSFFSAIESKVLLTDASSSPRLIHRTKEHIAKELLKAAKKALDEYFAKFGVSKEDFSAFLLPLFSELGPENYAKHLELPLKLTYPQSAPDESFSSTIPVALKEVYEANVTGDILILTQSYGILTGISTYHVAMAK